MQRIKNLLLIYLCVMVEYSTFAGFLFYFAFRTKVDCGAEKADMVRRKRIAE